MASSLLEARPLWGCLSFSLFTNVWKRSLSSAKSIASGLVPSIGIPACSNSRASFSGV